MSVCVCVCYRVSCNYRYSVVVKQQTGPQTCLSLILSPTLSLSKNHQPWHHRSKHSSDWTAGGPSWKKKKKKFWSFEHITTFFLNPQSKTTSVNEVAPTWWGAAVMLTNDAAAGWRWRLTRRKRRRRRCREKQLQLCTAQEQLENEWLALIELESITGSRVKTHVEANWRDSLQPGLFPLNCLTLKYSLWLVGVLASSNSI